MKEEIKKIIINNPEYIHAIQISSEVLSEIIIETKEKFKNQFNILFPKSIIKLNDGNYIEVAWGEDSDGLYFGYKLFKNEANLSNDDISIKYKDLLKEIDNGFFSNNNFIGWIHPAPFSPKVKFENLDKQQIIEMHSDQDKLKNFIESLIKQEKPIRDEFINRLSIVLKVL